MPLSRLTFILVILIAVLYTVDLIGAQFDTGTTTIETKSASVLYPHEHDPGDSVMDPGHHVLLTSNVFVPTHDLWITGISGEVVNAPPVVIHHGELLRLDTLGTDATCASAYGAGELLSFGQDQMYDPQFQFPEEHAFFIAKGTPLVLAAMLHDPLPPVGPGGTYHDVNASITLHEADPSTRRSLTPVTFRLLHLEHEPCRTDEMGYVFKVPAYARGFVFKGHPEAANDGSRYIFTHPATILYLGAHLHGWEGGRELRVYKNGELLTTFATHKSETDPYLYETPHYQTDLHMEAGDTLSIEAVYDNPYDVPLTGAMGMLGIFYAED